MLKFKEFFQNPKIEKIKKVIKLNWVNEPQDSSYPILGLWRRSLPALTELFTSLTKDECKFYSSFQLDSFSATTLHKFITPYVSTPVSPEDFHSTVIWSTKKLVDYKAFNDPITLNPETYKYNILGGCWVLRYSHPIPESQWIKGKLHGAAFTFDKYIPHITLSYEPGENFDFSNIPLPRFPITFTREVVEDIGV